MAPDTPGLEAARQAANYANSQDKLFVKLATDGGQAEIEIGKIAQKNASSDVVRKFADCMVADHGKSNDQLVRSGRALKLEIPKQTGVLDPEHKTVRIEVERANGTDFDRVYLVSQIQNHQKTANLLLWERCDDGSIPDVLASGICHSSGAGKTATWIRDPMEEASGKTNRRHQDCVHRSA